MNTTGKRIIQRLLAIVVILVMTMADLSIVGTALVSYAIDTATVNNQNVEFKAYFLDNNQTLEKSAAIDKNDLKIAIEVGVKKDGYLSKAKIELGENANFKFKTDTKNDYITSINEKALELKQVNDGETVKLEVGIEFAYIQEFGLDYLSKTSDIILSGTYVNSKNSNTSIEGKAELKVNWTSKEDIKSTLSSEILTNSIFNENGTNKRIVQLLVKSKIENNSYPVKNANIEVIIPGEPEKVEVHKRRTDASNGDRGCTASEFSQGKITISTNNNQNDKIRWKKDGEDEYIVTVKYSELAEVTNEKIISNSEITTYDDKNLKQNTETVISENKEALVSIVEKEMQSEIVKGKLYAGEEKEYKTNTEVYIDYSNMIQKVEIEESAVKAVKKEEEKELDVKYKNIKFNKVNLTNVLGDTWNISILDQLNNVKTITNETEADENGNITVEFEEKTNKINITTSKPVNNGVLEYEVTKVILKTTYTREQLREFIKIKDSNSVTYTKNDETKNTYNANATINLKETESKASLMIEPLTLTTSSAQDMKITAVLETDNENRDLFKNPVVKIKLPKQINKISAECSLMYGNGLEIKKGNFRINEENGQEVITIILTGEQKSFEGNGATLNIIANVELDKFSTNSVEDIIMTYTNENAISYVDNGEQRVNISIASENSMILTNNIEEYNISTFGKESDKEISIVNNSEAKNATVKMQIVNNEESGISNVAIFGKIANISGKIDRTSKIRTNIENVRAYYTSVDNPTISISNTENGWTEAEQKNAKYFLIVIGSLEKGQRINISYDIKVGDKLPPNLTTEALYKVSYTNNLSNTKKEVESTKIIITTGKVVELKAAVSAKVQGIELKDGEKVNAGEIIEYTATIKNEGTEKASNVGITATIPENTTKIEVNPKYPDYDPTMDEYTNKEKYFIEKADKQITLNNIQLEAGKSYTLTYMVKVNNTTESKTIKSTIVTKVGDNNIEGSISNIVEPSDIDVEIVPIFREPNTILDAGYNYIYEIYIKNLTNKEQKNVQVNLNKNNGLGVNTIYWNIDEDNFGEINKNSKAFSLDRIPANGMVTIVINSTAETNDFNIAEISATVANKYRSNKIVEKIQGVNLEATSTTTVDKKNKSSKYVEAGDRIIYNIKIKNIGKYDATELEIKDEFSGYLKLSKITLDGKQCEYETETIYEEDDSSYDILTIKSKLPVGKETVLNIEGIVDENAIGTKNVSITNTAAVFDKTLRLAEVVQTKYSTMGQGNSQDEDINNQDNPNNYPGYSITGTVWKDEDNSGERDSEEPLLSGIKVYAIDVETNKVAKYNNNEIVTTTDTEGVYRLNGLSEGKYIVAFEYDTEKYMVTTYQIENGDNTKNSDAVKASRTVNGEERTAAYTDVINVNEDISDIDLGLAESKVFSLKLDKVISKMIVTNKNGSKTYNFEDTGLAKVEISSKELSGSNVVIEYKLKVTNVGEVAGYAKTIVDYLPSSLKFNSGLNSDWYKKGNNLYTSSLADTLIEPGETKEVILTLTKKMTESNTGLTNNKAEIESAYNSLGIPNTVTTEKSGKTQNTGSADTIIGVKTGAAVSYVALTLTIIIVIGGLAYLVNKKLLLEKIEI